MPIKLIRLLLPLMFCTFCACDNSKNNVDNGSDKEPSLESFKRVALDSSFVSDSSEDAQEISEVEVESPAQSTPKNKPVSTPKLKKKRGVIVFDSLIYRLPEMYEGDKVSLEFRFTNEGEGPLSIKEVDVVCGCTTPEVPFLDILPGEEGKIGIQYNSVGKEGLQEPEITVISNGIPRKTVLKISVNVKQKEKIERDSLRSKAIQDSLAN